MARQVNGHLGTFDTLTTLTAKFPPSESIGCSANVGTSIPYTKAWCDGSEWALLSAPQLQSLVANAPIPIVSYNGAGKISSYDSAGITHTVTYPDSNTVRIVNSLGASRTIAVNNEGRVIAAI